MNDEQPTVTDISAKVVGILARLPRQMCHSLLGDLPGDIAGPLIVRLQQSGSKTFHVVKCFDDFIHVDDIGIQCLLSDINLDILCCALVGSPQNLRQRFFDNMSNRVSRLLIEDIGYFSETTGHQLIESARQEILRSYTKGVRQGVVQVNTNSPNKDNDSTVDDGMGEVIHQLHIVCEKTMARVIASYQDKLAATVLCQRVDRHRILLRMLQMERVLTPDNIPMEGLQKVARILACLRRSICKPLIAQLALQHTVIDLAVELRKYSSKPVISMDAISQKRHEIDVVKITEKLQCECIKAIAQLIVNCSDEVGASVLLQRQDSLQILQHLLQIDVSSQPYQPLSAQALMYLQNLLPDDD